MTGPVTTKARGGKPVAPPSEEFAGLGLDILRGYRKALRSEESRVSYWRRLVHARLDMVAAGWLSGRALTTRQIAVALGDGVHRHDRLAMLMLKAGDELPELPELTRLWSTPLDGAETDAPVVAALAEAEARLSSYRAALHALLDDATGELVSRYHADPRACLDVLPVEPRRAAG